MLDIIKTNFLELLNLFVKKPWVILVLLFIGSTSYFMTKWVDTKDDCTEQIAKIQNEKDSIMANSYNIIIQANREKDKIDSAIRNDLLGKIVELNKQIEELRK